MQDSAALCPNDRIRRSEAIAEARGLDAPDGNEQECRAGEHPQRVGPDSKKGHFG